MLSTARQLRKNLTDAEQILWRQIRGRQLKSFKFRRQSPIGKYIVDFVCFENRLVIGTIKAEGKPGIRYQKEGLKAIRIVTSK